MQVPLLFVRKNLGEGFRSGLLPSLEAYLVGVFVLATSQLLAHITLTGFPPSKQSSDRLINLDRAGSGDLHAAGIVGIAQQDLRFLRSLSQGAGPGENNNCILR